MDFFGTVIFFFFNIRTKILILFSNSQEIQRVLSWSHEWYASSRTTKYCVINCVLSAHLSIKLFIIVPKGKKKTTTLQKVPQVIRMIQEESEIQISQKQLWTAIFMAKIILWKLLCNCYHSLSASDALRAFVFSDKERRQADWRELHPEE